MNMPYVFSFEKPIKPYQKCPHKIVSVKIYVTDVPKSFNFPKISTATKLKELAISICDRLSLDIYKTDISFRNKYNFSRLDVAKTLF